MGTLWNRIGKKSSRQAEKTSGEDSKPSGSSRRVSKKVILFVAVAIALLVTGGYFLYQYLTDKNAPVDPAQKTEQNATQESIEQYKGQAKTPDEHLLVASLYVGDQKYQEAVDEIEKAYEGSRDVSILARQSIIMMDNLQDTGSERLRRNISALSSKSDLPPETTYRLAQLLEKTELSNEAKKFYQYTLDNFAKVTKDSAITKKELRAKIGEN